MRRSTWEDLPSTVREAVEQRAGDVLDVEPAKAGEHSDITATLRTPSGPVFVKGMRTTPEGPDLWALRREARIYPHVSHYAPRLLWRIEAGGWLLLAFEHVEGRHADYTPGSPDLDILAKLVEQLQAEPCPSILTRPAERRWEQHTDDVTPMAGASLVHLDLNPANLLITRDGRPRLVDWGFASRGAAWLEPALLIQWLIAAGHSPCEAEQWVSCFPSWQAAPPAHIDHFAKVNAAFWRDISARNPAPWVSDITRWVTQWAGHRLP